MVRGLEIAKSDADLVGDASYADLLSAIRKELQGSRVKAARAVNTELVALYWRIGTMILQRQEAEGWGAKVIDQLAAVAGKPICANAVCTNHLVSHHQEDG